MIRNVETAYEELIVEDQRTLWRYQMEIISVVQSGDDNGFGQGSGIHDGEKQEGAKYTLEVE